jgi:hypothetical protein
LFVGTVRPVIPPKVIGPKVGVKTPDSALTPMLQTLLDFGISPAAFDDRLAYYTSQANVAALAVEWGLSAADAAALDIKTFLGSSVLSLDTTYTAAVEAPLARVDVYVNLGGALTHDLPPGDLKRLYPLVFGPDGRDLDRHLLHSSRAHLTPTVCLMGRDGVNAPVTFENFDVAVFPVGTGHVPLAVACNVKPGCHGIMDEVQNFTGGCDYGVISDEVVVAKLFKHKWQLNGFLRTIPLSRNVQIKHNGNLEDAVVFGSLQLDSLDIVAIDVDANRRSDGIKIIGSGKITPQGVRLQDGRTVGPDEVDLGDAQQVAWGYFSWPSIDPPLPVQQSMRSLVLAAYRDAYRHMACPFARFPDDGVEVLYTRTEGVTKQVLVVGDISTPFI